MGQFPTILESARESKWTPVAAVIAGVLCVAFLANRPVRKQVEPNPVFGQQPAPKARNYRFEDCVALMDRADAGIMKTSDTCGHLLRENTK